MKRVKRRVELFFIVVIGLMTAVLVLWFPFTKSISNVVEEMQSRLEKIKYSLADLRAPNPADHWPWNPERMGDGCKHVFLDLGANIGVHNRFLFEPEYYPNTFMQEIFGNVFGDEWYRSLPSTQSGICAFAFEANPEHKERLKMMENCFSVRGHRLKVFVPSAVSDDKNKTLFFEKKQIERIRF